MPVIIIHSDGTVEKSAAEEVKVTEERRPQHLPGLELGLEVVVPSEPPKARPRPVRRPN